MSGAVSNIDALIRSLDVWVRQVEMSTVKQFRDEAKSIFMTLLETTPQASGRAVANWKIGINEPSNSFESDVGDQEIREAGPYAPAAFSHSVHPRQKGDPKWIEYAWLTESYKLEAGMRGSKARLQLGDTVYFTNNVVGDYNEKYLDQLQDPAVWSTRLRDANQPYITAAEVLIMHSWGKFADGGSTHLGKFV